MSSESTVAVIATGDVILNEPNPAFNFGPTAPIFASADIPVVHVEVPHTARGQQSVRSIPAFGAPVENLSVLGDLGVKIATLASNHSFDTGVNGIVDTRDALEAAGVTPVGAGVNLDDATRPAIREAKGVRVGVLSYNCVGPPESWATAGKPGCAYVKVLTHYEPANEMVGHPAEMYTFAAPDSLRLFQEEISRLAADVDAVIVSLHKGLGHSRAVVQDYERQISHAAIDAGAHIVIGHHAHIMRGVEVYKERPIYHGLGNFVTVSKSLNLENNNSPERLAWAKRRREMFGFEPDPNMPTYAFHPESRNTALARCEIGKSGLVESALIPCWIDDDVRPVPVTEAAGGDKVLDYIEAITSEAGFATRFDWKEDRVLVH